MTPAPQPYPVHLVAHEEWKAALSAQAQRDELVRWLKAVAIHLNHAPISEYERWNDNNADWLTRIEELQGDGSPLDPAALRKALP